MHFKRYKYLLREIIVQYVGRGSKLPTGFPTYGTSVFVGAAADGAALNVSQIYVERLICRVWVDKSSSHT